MLLLDTAEEGITGFAKTAAKELAAFGVTVNAMPPNAATRMTASIPQEKITELTGLHRLLTAVRSTVVLLCGFRPGLILPLDIQPSDEGRGHRGRSKNWPGRRSRQPRSGSHGQIRYRARRASWQQAVRSTGLAIADLLNSPKDGRSVAHRNPRPVQYRCRRVHHRRIGCVRRGLSGDRWGMSTGYLDGRTPIRKVDRLVPIRKKRTSPSLESCPRGLAMKDFRCDQGTLTEAGDASTWSMIFREGFDGGKRRAQPPVARIDDPRLIVQLNVQPVIGLSARRSSR